MSRVCVGLVVIGLCRALIPGVAQEGIVPGGWSGEVSYQSFGFAASGGMAGPAVATGWATPGFGAGALGSLPVASRPSVASPRTARSPGRPSPGRRGTHSMAPGP